MKILLLAPFLGLMGIALLGPGCKKAEVIKRNVYKDTTIGGNRPPDYSGVADAQVDAYINRLYIDLLGQEADSRTVASGREKLRFGGLSMASRAQFAAEILETRAADDRIFAHWSARMLNGSDSAEIQTFINLWIYTLEIEKKKPSPDAFYIQVLEQLLARDLALQNSRADFHAGIITIQGMFRRMLDNYIYDEINMGSENFVKASFENLYHRQPTASELAAGVKMADGQPAILLQADGASKPELMDIFVSNPECNEGIAVELYNAYLLRKPTPAEIVAHGQLAKTPQGFRTLQLSLLTSAEYAGF